MPDLVRTRKGWIVPPPTHCENGHELGAGRVLVGNQVCGGQHRGGHISWTCRVEGCGSTVYRPPLGSACRVLHGPAGVRNSFGPLVE